MSDPQRPPHLRVPMTFWARAEVLQALDAQDAGSLLRLVRQHTGASQHTIGAALEMAQPHVSQIMAGKREVTTLRTWQRLADGLGMPNEARSRLGLADAPDVCIPRVSASDTRSDGLWSAPSTVNDIAEATMQEMMRRREAIAVGGSLLVGAALTESLEPWLLPYSRPVDNQNGSVSIFELDRIEAATAALRHWDDRWRLGIRRRAVMGQLSEVADLAAEPQRASVQSRLFVVMSELSHVVASMSYDAGDHPTAQRYYTLALRALHQAGSKHRFYGVGILADIARQMLDTHRPQDALDITRLALDSAQTCSAPGTVMAMLRTREGWSYARMGRVEAYRRTVGQAEELIDERGPVPEWAHHFNAAELAGVVGARYRDLATVQEDSTARRRHAQMSATYIARALRLRDAGKKRNRAFDLIGLARTYLLLNEPEEAARVVTQAITLEGELGSGRVRRRLGDWYKEAASHHRVPEIAEVREELSCTLVSTAST